jgi:hypothetical protein
LASSAKRPALQFDLLRELPEVPVISGTLLSMELVTCQHCVDLAQVSQLVLSDLGATLQILRRAGREAETGHDCLERVEDCISWLGLEGCLEAMFEFPITRSTHFATILTAWDRAREIAVVSKFVAEKFALNVASEDAYLVGLANGIGKLPGILEWDWMSESSGNSDLTGLRMAEAWHLPHCIVDYFLDRLAGKTQTQWTMMVDCALELLEGRPFASIRDEFISLSFAPPQKRQSAASRPPAYAGS